MKLTWAAPSVGRFVRYGKKANRSGSVAEGLRARMVDHELVARRAA